MNEFGCAPILFSTVQVRVGMFRRLMLYEWLKCRFMSCCDMMKCVGDLGVHFVVLDD